MPAGNYSSRLLWLQGTRTQDTSNGQEVLTHTSNGYLWCSVEETNGKDTNDHGARQTGADAEIRVRNYPNILVDDILKDEAFEQFWKIESVYQGDNEMIVNAYRWDSLQDFDTEEGSS